MLRVLGLVATTAIVLAACGGAASPAPAPAATAAATAAPAPPGVAVTVQAFKFVPASLEVPVGTTVTWTNKDTAAHTATSGTPAAKDGKFDGPLEGTTGTFSFTFTTAGTYAYFCARHPTTMLATLVVK